MRRLLMVLGALALSTLASQAVADVRRAPPRVEWVGPLPTAAAGRTLTGSFRIVTSAPAEITNVRLEGAGWDARLVAAPARIRLEAAGAQSLRFEATPTDPSRPLVIRFEADGVPFEESIDMSPAAIARAAAPGSTVRVPEGKTLPFPGEGLDATARPDPLSAPAEGALRGKTDRLLNDSTEPTRTQARSIRVHGRFVYQRSDAVTLGADGVTIRVYDEDTGFDELVAQGVTDWNGFYDVTFNWDPCFLCDGQPDLYVEFESANTRVNVRTTGVFGGNYRWSSGTWNDYLGSDLDVGWLQPSDETQHPALHILTDITRDWRWYLNFQGYDLPHVGMYWPDGATGAYYDDGAEEIHVGTDRRWREDTHAHEYGHHFIYNYAVGQTPDYCNGICDTGGCGHCLWCRETNHDAWNEGWPNWIAHVQTSSYAGSYGVASMNTRDEESVQFCSTSLDDPTITEGFIGALLQDVWDAANEDDPGAPGTWRDRLTLGTDEIFAVTDFDHPLNPLDFIAKFKARYPWSKEQLWETAKNNTYEVDALPPPAVTFLGSPSHALFTSSPDPTVDLTWTRADDDWSGPGGYSISITGSPSFPDMTDEIGDVTGYTTGVLPPGTYYFNIRTRDRSGKWSGTYAAYGPFTIRLPEPANLTYYHFGGWAAPVVPRGAPDVTSGVPAPTTLPGNVYSTYWNLGGWNAGESATTSGFASRLYIDDVFHYWAAWNPIGAGGGFYGANLGPTFVTGGRHTFETRYDSDDAIAETNESDNAWGRQWIWTPLDLPANVTETRSAPPVRTAGWGSIVDGSPIYYNSDGLRFSSTENSGWWHAVWVYAANLEEDIDDRLHPPSATADAGFGSSSGISQRLAGRTDAVLVNRNVVGSPTTWDVGVINWTGGSSSYVARHVHSIILSFNDSVEVALPDGEMMAMREFYVGPANLGPVSITARIISGTGPVYLAWFDRTFTTGGLLDADATAVADGVTKARIDLNLADTGWNGIALYRDPVDGTDPVTVVLEMETTPPDFTPYYAAGWYSPFVPRAAPDGTPASVPLPDVLLGDVESTYLNFSVTNQGPTGADGLLGQVYLDGIYSWYLAYGFFPGGATSLFNWYAPWTVRGGRHTLSAYYDQIATIEEMFEDNNLYGEQYVWSPQSLALGAPVARGAPPDPIGGWLEITSAPAGIWYNCDGLQSPGFTRSGSDGYWGAVAIMPGASSDVDLRLHEIAPGVQNGFGPSAAISAWGLGQSDYVMLDFNLTHFRAYDAGMLRYGAGFEGYTAEAVNSTFRGSYPNGLYGPYALDAGHILQLHEFYLAPGLYDIDLFNESGSVDWGITVHPADVSAQSKSTSVPDGSSWFGGPGAGESVTIDLAAGGFYCVAVWKVGSDDLPEAGEYILRLRPHSVDVPDALPVRTAFAGVYPNPLRTSATVAFDLASEAPASVDVYDVNGARVRTMVHGRWPAGRHQVTWRGDGDDGRPLAPGVYMLRFSSAGQSATRKVVKLE